MNGDTSKNNNNVERNASMVVAHTEDGHRKER